MFVLSRILSSRLHAYIVCSVARESMHIQMVLDSLGEDLYSEELSRRELEVDKEIIKLIQNACKSDRNPRVLELVRMLHHTSSFDMAIKVADFYHQVGLQEKIKILKEDREDGDRLVDQRDKRRRWTRDHDPVPPPRLPPADANGSGRMTRPFQDFAPPPTADRPGLTKATPIFMPVTDENQEGGFSRFKRKRKPEDDTMDGGAETPDGSKRRMVDEVPEQTEIVDDLPSPAPKPMGEFSVYCV